MHPSRLDMLNFLTNKLAGRAAKPEADSEAASDAGRGFGVISNQTEYSESIHLPPSEINADLDESSDRILISQLQRESEDLKEVLNVLTKRQPILEADVDRLSKEKLQLLRIIDQLYTLHEKAGEKESSPVSTPSHGNQDDEKESVRNMLRMAITEADLKDAIEAARALDMSFEVTLGEKKLSKLSD